MNLQTKVFKKFREKLPTEISDKVIEQVVKESVDRLQNLLQTDPSFLLSDEIDVEIDNKFFVGDIHVFGGGQYGISWIFNRESGYLHTT